MQALMVADVRDYLAFMGVDFLSMALSGTR